MGGGAEKVLLDTVNSLPSSDYEITVQTIFDMGIYKSQLNKCVKYLSIYHQKCKLLMFIYQRFYFRLLNCKKFYRRHIDKDYDIEVAFLEGFPTKIISNSTNKKATKIAWVHTDIAKFPNSIDEYSSLKKCINAYDKFDKIACVSDGVKEAFVNVIGDCSGRVRTVYNIVDEKEIRRKSIEKIDDYVDYKRPVFISCGRLCSNKGYDRLLDVHNRLVKEGYNHTLMILGTGEDEKQLKTFINENKLNSSAFLLGFKSNPYKYIKNADLFICSSRAEGYSTVVTESVVVGTPVLSTNVAGANEPISNPRCSLIVDNNVDGLYSALKNILQNPYIIDNYKDGIVEKQKSIEKKYLVAKLCEFLEE